MSVWEKLGIEATDDERSIKRAYAKKLKLIRPDEDARLFQELREARDEALYLAQFDYIYDDWDEEYEESEDEHSADVVDNSDKTIAPSEVAVETGETTSLTQTEADPFGPPCQEIAKEAIPEDQQDYTIRLDETKIKPHDIIEQKEEIITQLSEIPPEAIIRLEDEEQGAEQLITPFQELPIDDITYQHMDAELESLMGPWHQWNLENWQAFIRKVRECSFDISNYAEYEILVALGTQIAEGPPLSNEKFAQRKTVLTYLNEEYGWTENDRRVYDIMIDTHAERLMEYLRDEDGLMQLSEPEEFYDTLGFPKLTEQHFHDFLGKNGTSYEKYYQHCRENGREYQNSWCWPAFIFSILWLARRCNDGLEALTGIGFILISILLYHGIYQNSPLSAVIAISALIGIHFTLGYYGKRLVINTMATTLTELSANDELTKFQKLKKMQEIGNGGLKAIYDLVAGLFGIGLIAALIYSIII